MTEDSHQMERTVDIMKRNLKQRYAAERRFRYYGFISIGIALLFLLFLFADIIGKGYTAFQQTEMRLAINLVADEFPDTPDDESALYGVDYQGLIKKAGILIWSKMIYPLA